MQDKKSAWLAKCRVHFHNYITLQDVKESFR
jgi:hypothetical protein